jgi:hypothetical protein
MARLVTIGAATISAFLIACGGGEQSASDTLEELIQISGGAITSIFIANVL